MWENLEFDATRDTYLLIEECKRNLIFILFLTRTTREWREGRKSRSSACLRTSAPTSGRWMAYAAFARARAARNRKSRWWFATVNRLSSSHGNLKGTFCLNIVSLDCCQHRRSLFFSETWDQSRNCWDVAITRRISRRNPVITFIAWIEVADP